MAAFAIILIILMTYSPWLPIEKNSMTDWLMVGLTALATLLVWRTVIYTKGVLDEAKKATTAANRTVDETRRIGEAQVRAYLSITRAKCTIGEGKIEIPFRIKNNGQSPAHQIKICAKLCTSNSLNQNGCNWGEHNDVGAAQLVAPNSEEQTAVVWYIDKFKGDHAKAIENSHSAITISVYITWLDVFGKKNSQSFTLSIDNIEVSLKYLKTHKNITKIENRQMVIQSVLYHPPH